METLTLDQRVDALIQQLTLEEIVQLLTGRNFWTTWPLEKIGLRPILVSDGPTGVRGEVCDERQPSMNFPSATAISSSWDPAIADRLGAASAVEARRKDVDVVLGSTINLHSDYAEKPGSAVDRPVRWLVATAPVRAEAGGTVTTVLHE